MKKHLLMLSAVMVALAARPASAATCSTSTSANGTATTTITTALTAPIDTCTDGNIQISTGSVKISTASTAAVTLNTNNQVSNGGTIANTGQSNVEGILIDATHGPLTFAGNGVSNAGTIDLTGAGSTKSGIKLANGTFNSSIVLGSSSIINIKGDNSTGINILSGGVLAGQLTIDGAINVAPSTSTSLSVSSDTLVTIAGTVNGNVTMAPTAVLTGTGQNTQGIVVTGSINAAGPSLGTLENDGTVNLTGIAVPVGQTAPKSAPEAGSALEVTGNIAGGILNAGPVGLLTPIAVGHLASSGLTTTSGGVAAVVSIFAPAVGTGITIGQDTADTDSGKASFINRGTILAQPLNSNDTTAVFISGSTSTTTATLTGAFFSSGAISAIASSTNSPTPGTATTATSILIGQFTNIPSIVISGESSTSATSTNGSVSAFVSGTGNAVATGINLETGANVATINITNPGLTHPGKIIAVATTINPTTATQVEAFGIVDQSNTLKNINVAGILRATVTTLTPLSNATVLNVARAIDLSSDTTGGITINDAGSITGDVLLNSADSGGPHISNLNVGVGTAVGAPTGPGTQGEQAANALTATGGTANSGGALATLNGDMVFGSGTYALNVNDFGSVAGSIINHNGTLNVGVSAFGALSVMNTTQTALVNNFDVYGSPSHAQLQIATSETLRQLGVATITVQAGGHATIASGTSLGVTIGSYIPQGTNDYVLISTPAGKLNVADFLTYQTNVAHNLPFFFDPANSSLTCALNCVNSDKLILHLTPKTAAGLGLNGNALHIFSAASQALLQDPTLGAAVVNGIQDPAHSLTNTPEQVFSQFAPDVSGDIRQIAIQLTDQATGPVAARQRTLRMYANQDGDFSLWGQEFAEYFSDKGNNGGEITKFKDHGFGFAIGADGGDPADGWYGGAFTFYAGDATQVSPENSKTQTEWYLLTGYTDWRGRHLFLDTHVDVGVGSFRGKRFLTLSPAPITGQVFSCGVPGQSCSREADSKRPGLLGAIGGTTGAIFNFGQLVLMPEIALDALTMREEGYTEKGGGNGFNLSVQPYYATSLRTFIGADSRVDVDLGDFTLQPEARLGYRFDFLNDPVKIKGAFAAAPADKFTITGPDPSRGNVVAGATIGASTDTFSLGVNFDWVRGSNGSTTEVGTFSLLGRI